MTYLLDRPLVEAAGLELHDLDLLPDVLDAQGTREPERAPLDESLDVLPPDEGNVVAEAASVRLDQAGAMLRFFPPQLVEDLRGLGIGLAQPIGEVGVDATVLLFERNSQGENVTLGKLAEFLRHHEPRSPCEIWLTAGKETHDACAWSGIMARIVVPRSFDSR